MNNSYNVENGKIDLPPAWWKKRSKMEKRLSIFSVITVLLIFTLLIVIIIHFTRGPTTCTSASCVQTTSDLLDHMDLNANPCEDFYQFACGGFVENVQLEDKPYKTVETFMYEDGEEKMRGLIEEPIDYQDPRSIALAKNLYKACMNESSIEERGLRLIKNNLKQIGGWPVVEGGNWQEKNFDWKRATYKLRQLGYGFEFFIRFDIIDDEIDPTRRVIQLSSPYSPLFGATDEEEELYYNYMVNLSVALGADRTRAKNEARDVIDFQKSLFLNPETIEIDDDKYDPLTMSELQYKFHDIPWLEYFNTLQSMTPNITHSQLVTVSNPSYFIRLQNALRSISKSGCPSLNILRPIGVLRAVLAQFATKMDIQMGEAGCKMLPGEMRTGILILMHYIEEHNNFIQNSFRVLANYICWRTVSEHSTILTAEIDDLAWNYYKQIINEEPPPRPKRCFELVFDLYTLPMQAVYVRRYLSDKTKVYVTEMLLNIKEEFRKVLLNIEWMDEETRIRALERLSTGKQYVVYPEDLLNNDKIEQRYIGVQVDEENFLSSFLNTKFHTANHKFQKLHEPGGKDKELDEEYATAIQCTYSAADNTITIPAGLLQGIIYDEDRPQYLNYGALGSTIGHQIFHTIFEGKKCRRESKHYDWITTHTFLAYNDILSCVALHYGKYIIQEIGEYLNSSNTKNEDLADIVGVKLAYNAYILWMMENGPEQKLPGLEYTPQQLFWISSAVRFCGKGSKEALASSVAHNYRSLPKFKVLGSLRNSEEFAMDFGCSRNSYMNAEDRCKIW